MSDTHQRHTPRTRETRADSLHIAGWCPKDGAARFANKKDARRAVRRARSRHDDPNRRMVDKYRCGDHWHIGPRTAV